MSNFKSILEIEQHIQKVMPPGISRQAIYEHIRRSGLKKNKTGKYDLDAFLEYYVAAKQRDNKNVSSEGSPKATPNQAKTYLQCQLLKLELEKRKGELMPKTDCDLLLIESHGIVKNRLLNLKREVSQKTSDIEAVKAVESMVVELLKHLEGDFK